MAGPTLERALQMVQDIETAGKSAVKSAVMDNADAILAILNEEYQNAAMGWYGAYIPKKHKRHYSIRNLMSADDSTGTDIGWKFTDDQMTKSSTGGSLFDTVFLGGSHGLRHRSFVPVVTTPTPDLFEDGMQTRVDEIGAILLPDVESYLYGKLSR